MAGRERKYMKGLKRNGRTLRKTQRHQHKDMRQSKAKSKIEWQRRDRVETMVFKSELIALVLDELVIGC